ncbi:MAG TPA: prepilin-type N-terminal cleavage/methylation domain-containing protein [Candidatus Saccharibacteria bacterium]|jgi:Tfp pilus assembly protein PilX|nr:prepilin-type N-terminal cleavage/methylation domain-containing protein [Candidatus Saccharibacteria bacterium]HMR38504.1 prepilin-type N-terminal cleavage/methylation domain-containing protein [Candidatus Saccharibacteria bacterium]
MNHQQQIGFTAVEVLITLFIAVLFIAGAYQVYGIVLNNSTESREQAIASNYAYQALRQYADQTVNNCTASGPVNANSLLPSSNSGLASPQLRVVISCPYGTTTTLKRITAYVEYKNSSGATEKVSHAILTR